MERRERVDEDDAEDQSREGGGEGGRRDVPRGRCHDGPSRRAPSPSSLTALRVRHRSLSATPPGRATDTPSPSSDESPPPPAGGRGSAKWPAHALSPPNFCTDCGQEATVRVTCRHPTPPPEGAARPGDRCRATVALMEQLASGELRKTRFVGLFALREGGRLPPQEDQPVARVAEALNHVALQEEDAQPSPPPRRASPSPAFRVLPPPESPFVPWYHPEAAKSPEDIRHLPVPQYRYQLFDEGQQTRYSPGPYHACLTQHISTDTVRETTIFDLAQLPTSFSDPVHFTAPYDNPELYSLCDSRPSVTEPPFNFEEMIDSMTPGQHRVLSLMSPPPSPLYQGPYMRVASPSVLFRHSIPFYGAGDPELDQVQVSAPEEHHYDPPAPGEAQETPDTVMESSRTVDEAHGASNDQEDRSLPLCVPQTSVAAAFVPQGSVKEEPYSGFDQIPGPSGDQENRRPPTCVPQVALAATFVNEDPSSSYNQQTSFSVRRPLGTVTEEPSSAFIQTPGPSRELPPRRRSHHCTDDPSPRPRQGARTRGRPPRQPRNFGPGLCGPCPPLCRAFPSLPILRPMGDVRGGKRRKTRNKGGGRHQANRSCHPSTSTGEGGGCPGVVRVVTTRWFQKRGLRPWYGECSDQGDGGAQTGRGGRGGRRGRGCMHRPWLLSEEDQPQSEEDDKAPDQGSG